MEEAGGENLIRANIAEITQEVEKEYDLEQYLYPIRKLGYNIVYQEDVPKKDQFGRERFGYYALADQEKKTLFLNPALFRESPEFFISSIIHEYYHIDS